MSVPSSGELFGVAVESVGAAAIAEVVGRAVIWPLSSNGSLMSWRTAMGMKLRGTLAMWPR